MDRVGNPLNWRYGRCAIRFFHRVERPREALVPAVAPWVNGFDPPGGAGVFVLRELSGSVVVGAVAFAGHGAST
jgi:hypothetical protein